MSRKWLRLRQLLVALICTAGLGTTLFGQNTADSAAQAPATPAAADQPAPAEASGQADDPAAKDAAPAPKADNPASDAPATPATAPVVTAADAAADQAAFAANLDKWKTILKSLRALTPRYSLATPEEAAGIVKEWDELIAQGEQLIPKLRETGTAAYVSGRGGDRNIERFLTKLLADDINHDRFEQAYELGAALIDGGCEVKEVLDATGVAAFCTNDFDLAETLLKRAQDAGSLSKEGTNFLSLIDEYKLYWAEEKALREKEAADDDLPRVKVTTTRGELIVELLENEAPETVGNFVNLVESKKFYDGLKFHRVLPGFMAQGGCPQGNGSGGPGYMIKCETDVENRRNHFRGSLSMAHAGKDTGGSQFFLTFVPTAHLNGKHTVFGRVIEGMDVLAKLERIDPTQLNPQAKPDSIVKIELLRKRDHEYKPNKSQ